jgi:hypothetical protein
MSRGARMKIRLRGMIIGLRRMIIRPMGEMKVNFRRAEIFELINNFSSEKVLIELFQKVMLAFAARFSIEI